MVSDSRLTENYEDDYEAAEGLILLIQRRRLEADTD
jgi:hypothetical protein